MQVISKRVSDAPGRL